MLFDILENHFDSVQIEFEGTYLGQTGPSEIFLLVSTEGKTSEPCLKTS